FAEDKIVDFTCDPLDFICKNYESTANGLADAANWMADFALGGQEFATGGAMWNTATDQAGLWLGMAVIVMIITATVGFATAAIAGRGDLVKRTLFGTLLSFPATLFAYFIVGKGLDVIDEFSEGLLASITDDYGGFGAVIEAMFRDEVTMLAVAETAVGAGATLYVRVLIVVLAIFIGVLFITVAMAFRNFVLMLLIAFAPLAFVLLPAKGGGTWVKRWLAAVVAMALAKPLMLGTLALVLAGFREIGTVWTPAAIYLLIGLLITAFMPLMAYSFFQFIGGDGGAGDQVGQRVGSSTTQKVQQGGQMAVNRHHSNQMVKQRQSAAAPPVAHHSPQPAAGGNRTTVAPSGGGRPGAGAGAQPTLQPKVPTPPAGPKK
ncbi:MAG: hypothetical protein GX862_10165, partial [Leucobacter sp.]|nr:hypothetical protein [Leucobacter sp.]